ncbi:MAG: hypothetical protein ACKVHI_01625 [Candidatus Puniceispirillales bacterium]
MSEPADVTEIFSIRLSSSLISYLPTVPILMLPLAEAEETIEVMDVNFVEPTAVFEEVTPVMFSVIVVPSASVPVTVNTFPVSEAEQ